MNSLQRSHGIKYAALAVLSIVLGSSLANAKPMACSSLPILLRSARSAATFR